MANNELSTLSVELIEEHATFTLTELCHCFGVEAELIKKLVEQGILDPINTQGGQWCFPSSSLQRTRITLHLQRDLGVNLEGAALALDLLERIDILDARLSKM